MSTFITPPGETMSVASAFSSVMTCHTGGVAGAFALAVCVLGVLEELHPVSPTSISPMNMRTVIAKPDSDTVALGCKSSSGG